MSVRFTSYSRPVFPPCGQRRGSGAPLFLRVGARAACMRCDRVSIPFRYRFHTASIPLQSFFNTARSRPQTETSCLCFSWKINHTLQIRFALTIRHANHFTPHLTWRTRSVRLLGVETSARAPPLLPLPLGREGGREGEIRAGTTL